MIENIQKAFAYPKLKTMFAQNKHVLLCFVPLFIMENIFIKK